MNVIPPALARLIADFGRLPGVGRKTASRLAMHLLRRPAVEAQALAKSLTELHQLITMCSTCCAFSEADPCEICCNPDREQGLVCVVEEPADLVAIEKTASFKGKYHILHGVLSPADGIGPGELKIDRLLERIRRDQVNEVLIATSSTVPGEATAAYLIRHLQENSKVRITRLACGIPMGMDIKYADELTLSRAIASRQQQ
ncbi:recombination mediator RecR [Desulfurivibrio alkaliphilus]|uniref:Recombination protein RecR n=1 Tax=Desulfurivibrio alkaliphilus (strain DSM 19089 / UNIQEM U267 / AHT2) TaxID=589865 RepID=D6Z317_DESAT|nr:recombination mediator RecR [Desulfurivibrio alkaliphilus]ADH85942.1 recombination protein RecR [Desulfurivibrio alkaliphilus AHT 2]